MIDHEESGSTRHSEFPKITRGEPRNSRSQCLKKLWIESGRSRSRISGYQL
jgi:hypothetical protein